VVAVTFFSSGAVELMAGSGIELEKIHVEDGDCMCRR
jgi:hypothetical protein